MSFNFDKKLELNESGKAIKNCQPITGDQAVPIAQQLISIIREKYPNLKFAPLGSTGKKNANQTSGDIDIAVEADFSEAANIETYIKTKYPNIEVNYLKGFHILSIGFPYQDKSGSNKIVQSDLMFFPNIELARYFYHSPDYTKNESNFKGAIRNMLMLNILKNIPVNSQQNTSFDNGHPKDIYKYTFQPEQGLVIVHQTFLGKKGQEVKNKQTVKDDTKVVSTDTNYITHFMMGDQANAQTINSFESMVNWMMTDQFPYRQYNQQIFEGFYDYVKRQSPEELSKVQNYINQAQNGLKESKAVTNENDIHKEIKKVCFEFGNFETTDYGDAELCQFILNIPSIDSIIKNENVFTSDGGLVETKMVPKQICCSLLIENDISENDLKSEFITNGAVEVIFDTLEENEKIVYDESFLMDFEDLSYQEQLILYNAICMKYIFESTEKYITNTHSDDFEQENAAKQLNEQIGGMLAKPDIESGSDITLIDPEIVSALIKKKGKKTVEEQVGGYEYELPLNTNSDIKNVVYRNGWIPFKITVWKDHWTPTERISVVIGDLRNNFLSFTYKNFEEFTTEEQIIIVSNIDA